MLGAGGSGQTFKSSSDQPYMARAWYFSKFRRGLSIVSHVRPAVVQSGPETCRSGSFYPGRRDPEPAGERNAGQTG